jgi:hypothetical protein
MIDRGTLLRVRAAWLLPAIAGCSPHAEAPATKADAPAPAATPEAPATDVPATIEPAAEPTPAAAPTCTAACVPRTIAEGRYPGRLAVDANDVLWIQGEELRRAPRAGGSATVLAKGVLSEGLAIDDTAAYVCRRRADLDRDVLRVPRDGTEGSILATAIDCQLAAGATHLYLAARVSSWKKSLARVPKTGGTLQAIGPESNQLPRIAIDGAEVFWASDATVQRFDEATEKVVTVVTDSGEIEDLTVTRTHVYWMRNWDLWRAPRAGGGTPERVANHQNALQMASDGTRVYWASVGDEHWTRYDPEKNELHVRALDPGPGSIAVHGSEVFVSVFGVQGRVEGLETCGCDGSVLKTVPPIRVAEGPDTEDEIRAGWADPTGRVEVQIRDLSGDEMREVDALLASGSAFTLEDERVPARFRGGGKFRVTTTDGVFDAPLVGVTAGMGGEGTHFYVFLQGPPAVAGKWALVTRDGGPSMGPLKSATPDPEAARKVLTAVRKASEEAGHGRRVGRNHVTAVRGNFPAPHVFAVTVAFPSPAATEDDLSEVSAFWFTDAAGNVTHELFGLEQRLDTYQIDFLVDVAEDGTDEIVFNSRYYEGAYDHLLEWDGSKPSFRTLSGDGA